MFVFIVLMSFSKFKVLIRGRLFWARSLLSTGAGELIFTVIGGIMVWGGLQPWWKIAHIMFNAYVFKMLYASIAVWPTVWIAKLLKRLEQTDVFDDGINYNPFNLSAD